MHELGIAENILEIVRQSIPEGLARDIRKIRVRVGRFAGVVPDSLDFCFGVMAGESEMPGAALLIEEVPTSCRCRGCGREFELEELVFLCPHCGGSDLEVISGKELEVVDIELVDHGGEAL
ncbi:MAG: hydrogenase maturation nickel metallochaperone HypA [Acidobacteria bacterium]|nr:hydrogenase maturation nickel metallochaperone HypA [Acidobacteriota bacterium]